MSPAEYGRVQRIPCPLDRWLEYKNAYSASRELGREAAELFKVAAKLSLAPPERRLDSRFQGGLVAGRLPGV